MVPWYICKNCICSSAVNLCKDARNESTVAAAALGPYYGLPPHPQVAVAALRTGLAGCGRPSTFSRPAIPGDVFSERQNTCGNMRYPTHPNGELNSLIFQMATVSSTLYPAFATNFPVTLAIFHGPDFERFRCGIGTKPTNT